MKFDFQNIRKFGKEYFISHRTLKGKVENSLQLSEMLMKLILDQHRKIQAKGLVWGDLIDPHVYNKRLKSLLVDAGIDPQKAIRMSSHKARHTFATQALQHGTIKDVQALLGHQSARSTQIYIHAVPKNQNSIIQKITDSLK